MSAILTRSRGWQDTGIGARVKRARGVARRPRASGPRRSTPASRPCAVAVPAEASYL